MAEELIVFHSAGAIPGIPGEFGAGAYYVDREKRTVRPFEYPVVPAPAEEVPAKEAALESPPGGSSVSEEQRTTHAPGAGG